MKRILAILLSCVMLLALMPMAAFTVSADYIAVYDPSADEVYVGNVKMTNRTYLAVGATKTQTTKPDGGYAYFEAGNLTLYNYSYSGALTEQPFYYVGDDRTYFAAITAGDDLTIRLLGVSTLSLFECSGDDVSAAVCVEGNLTIVDTGTLNITGAQCGIVACEGDLIIEKFSTINAQTIYEGILADSGNITIRSNATVNIESENYGITTEEGAVTIQSGLVNVNAINGRALRSANDLTITDSRVTMCAENWHAIHAIYGDVLIQNSYVDAQAPNGIAIATAYGGNVTIEDSDVNAVGYAHALWVDNNIYVYRSALNANVLLTTGTFWALRADGGTIVIETDEYQVVRGYPSKANYVEYSASDNKNYRRVQIVSERYIYVGGVKLTAGEYLANGATKTQTTQLSDKYAYYGADGTLTLKNYSYSGAGYYGSNGSFCGAIIAGEDLTISLIGENTIDMQNTDNSYAVYTGGALRITAAGDASLSIQNTYEGIDAIGDVTLSSGDVEIVSDSYAIYSEDVVMVSGSNLWATSESDDGIYSDKGVVANGGSMHVTADLTAINTVGSYWQLAGSDVTLEGINGGISANGVLVSGGNLNATADMQAIYSHGAISMNNCNATLVSTNVSKDDTFAALYSRSDSITIGKNVVATVSRFNDGSSPEPFDTTQFANYDYVSLSSPIKKLDFYLEGYRAGGTLAGLQLLGHANLDRSGYMELSNKLVEGNYYTFQVLLKIDDFQGDPAKDITLDGRRPSSVEPYSDGSGYILSYDLPSCPGSTWAGVRVIDLELPRGGESPDYTATVFNPYAYKFSDYGMDGCGFYWYDSEGGVMMPEDTFVAGETYSLEMKFEPNMANGVTAFDTSGSFYGAIDLKMVDTMVSSKNAYIMEEFVCTAGYPVRVGGVGMGEGTYLAVGATQTQLEKPDGGYAYYNQGKLTLHNYSYEGEGSVVADSVEGAIIFSENYLEILLEGENTLTTPAGKTKYVVPIKVQYADCKIEGTENSTLTLNSNGKSIFIRNGSLTVLNADLTIRNTGSTAGIYVDHGDITMTSSTIDIESYNDGIETYAGDVTMFDCDLKIKSSEDGGMEVRYGFCDIRACDINIQADYYGIRVYGRVESDQFAIVDSTIVVDSPTGIQSDEVDVYIDNSDISVTTSWMYDESIKVDYGKLDVYGSRLTVKAQDIGSHGIWVYDDANFTDSTVVVISGYHDIISAYGDINITRCELDLKSYYEDYNDGWALYVSEGHNINITLASGQEIVAATEPNGTLVPYVAADNNTYDHVVIRGKAETPDFLKGDTNGDGKVNISDAMQAFYFVNEKISLDDAAQARADVNGDGLLTIADAMKIFYYVNEKISSL